MEEIKIVKFFGFSSTYAPFYSDEFTIERDGNVYYNGIINEREYPKRQ